MNLVKVREVWIRTKPKYKL